VNDLERMAAERDQWKSAYTQALERAELAEQNLLTAGAHIRVVEQERNACMSDKNAITIRAYRAEDERDALLRGQGADQAIITEWSEMKAVLRTLISGHEGHPSIPCEECDKAREVGRRLVNTSRKVGEPPCGYTDPDRLWRCVLSVGHVETHRMVALDEKGEG
jgi:hypothetical protein